MGLLISQKTSTVGDRIDYMYNLKRSRKREKLEKIPSSRYNAINPYSQPDECIELAELAGIKLEIKNHTMKFYGDKFPQGFLFDRDSDAMYLNKDGDLILLTQLDVGSGRGIEYNMNEELEQKWTDTKIGSLSNRNNGFVESTRRQSMKRNLRESKDSFKKAYESFFCMDWLKTYYAKDNDCEKLFARFIKEFEIYLEDDINDIDTSNFEDYLLDFLDDTDDETFNKLYGLFLNYLEQEDEFMVSEDYCNELYRVDSGAMEESLYLNKSVVDEVIDENWDNEDGLLGFKHKKDLKEAVVKAAEDYGVYDKEIYDAGSYG